MMRQREGSEAGSDILVGPPAGQQPRVEVKGGRYLIIRLGKEKLSSVVFADQSDEEDEFGINASDDYDDFAGRNARGTYSKAYTLRHPDIAWVHRGQGRYLPAGEIKRSLPSEPIKRSRHSRVTDPNHATIDNDALMTEGLSNQNDSSRPTTTQPFPVALQARASNDFTDRPPRKRRIVEQESLNDSLSTPPTTGLRQRPSTQLTPSATDMRAARLARRAQPVQSIERQGRSIRRSDSYAIADTSDEDSEDEKKVELGDKEPTFSKQYVDAHPRETFYHAGNGWYKRGERPRKSSTRHSDFSVPGLPKEQSRSFSQMLDRARSYHKDELDDYPGMEFHHCGNGYYRVGPDPAGKRGSHVVKGPNDAGPTGSGTVDKAYMVAHPEEEWVHRGAGRYLRKSEVDRLDLEAGASATPVPSARRESEPQQTFDKQHAIMNGMENFHHVGGGRYRRSYPMTENPEAESEDESGRLYGKAYVDAHPNEEFHHRGQGRYAKGPKPVFTAPIVRDKDESEGASEPAYDEGVSAPATKKDELFDTSYVAKHPDITFYHKGQGRWAKGLPPPGSHNKVAVRGPGAAEYQARRQSEDEEFKEDPALKGAPPLTALVTREEGPTKFPTINWYYRGGGKWSRISKFEAEARGEPTYREKLALASKRRRQARMVEDPEAQIGDESVVGETGTMEDNELDYSKLLAKHMKPPRDQSEEGTRTEKPKRRKPRKQRATLGRDGDDAGPSKPVTPPEPIKKLTEEEDVLGPEDLVPLYGEWPADEQPLDPLDRLYRKTYKPINTEAMHNALTKHPVEARPTSVLYNLADHFAGLLAQLQEEYLEVDRIIAPHAKVPRKPAKGGREPIDPMVFEDKKEADLYDYAFDPRKIGEQDPQAQKIVRDAEGRELRKRRNRSGVDAAETVPGWDFGEGAGGAGAKRQSRQPHRFESVVEPPRRRGRASNIAGNANSKAGSLTPDRAATPSGNSQSIQGSFVGGNYVPATAGRWKGHVPKRVAELKENPTPAPGPAPSTTPDGKPRKGRPPGSKNLHKRSDAGIKKGPRKKKVVEGADGATGATAGPSNPAAGTAELTGAEAHADGTTNINGMADSSKGNAMMGGGGGADMGQTKPAGGERQAYNPLDYYIQ
ncbi:hypothetical protein D0860_01405 [Hortaea werneckii]|uniref:Uncharacterized protein n=1 Tax=Hortaea werneckii TaxID=91943 RepID=A0A3M7HRQ1_HORWE|nr:hypothetical protein D0860_01405 [Hortaea werneckii]